MRGVAEAINKGIDNLREQSKTLLLVRSHKKTQHTKTLTNIKNKLKTSIQKRLREKFIRGNM